MGSDEPTPLLRTFRFAGGMNVDVELDPAALVHGVTPPPPAGSEHYREGWRDGYTQHAQESRAGLELALERAAEFEQRANTWEAACLAAMSGGLDPETSARVKTRIRELIEPGTKDAEWPT